MLEGGWMGGGKNGRDADRMADGRAESRMDGSAGGRMDGGG